jgi:hypothetical protein
VPSCRGGNINLTLDTYNPGPPSGTSFFGSEIISNQTFEPVGDDVLTFRVRFRTPKALPGGIVVSAFTYDLAPGGATRSEIDLYEYLSKPQPQGPGIMTNVFVDAGFVGEPGDPVFHVIDNFDPLQYHEVVMTWSTQKVEYYLDGQKLRTLTGADVPTGASTFRANIWAPAASWPDAYDPSLEIAQTRAQNRTYTYQVDYIEVTRE